ncbi:uncharacterized protein UBRO_06008 [Ustilago bromivora]|uniref:Coilin n=1 Tax=Ustilago bromivora TaxID=307758 RepID=A0A1K0GA82_9BASI|nr:uncharacterized protein UBRO_06008 [Ustilago bromivora]SYW75788.1 uncharacterized protein UBRO2_00943 [Ustilago bromivora]
MSDPSLSRKIRLRIVTRYPLPELHFLAPFNYDHGSHAFEKLQRSVYSHLKSRGGEGGGMERWGNERLVFMMDSFEVPFDDPEVLRDGDLVDVHLNPQSIRRDCEGGDDADQGGEAEEEEEEEEDAEGEGLDAEEREAVLEAKRIAAILRVGMQSIAEEDEEVVTKARLGQVDDLPRMPNSSCLGPSKLAKSASKVLPSFPTMSTIPIPPPSGVGGGGGGAAAAALAAFETRRKQMQLQPPIRNAVPGSSRKRARSDPSSSCSCSCSSSSSSNSSSASSSDSDSCSSSTSSSSSDTGSDSIHSSDSAPSEHHTVTDRNRFHANTHSSEQEQNLVPPGLGTNRTKRRNAIRREKARLERQAENLHNFLEARERAAQRELICVQDREPMGKIQGSSSCLLASAGWGWGSGSGLRLPPGGASLDLTTVETEKGMKRKRDQTPSPLLRRAQPTLETAEQGKSPYAGKVPENLVVGHVDCQGYYDQEVERLQAEAMYRDKGEGGRKRVEGKGKRGAMQVEDTNAKLAFLLDYGLPDEEQHGPRKKARLEQRQEAITLKTDTPCVVATSEVEAEACSINDCSSSDEATHSVRNSGLSSNEAHTDCDVVWERIKSKYTPSQLASLVPASAIESHRDGNPP